MFVLWHPFQAKKNEEVKPPVVNLDGVDTLLYHELDHEEFHQEHEEGDAEEEECEYDEEVEDDDIDVDIHSNHEWIPEPPRPSSAAAAAPDEAAAVDVHDSEEDEGHHKGTNKDSQRALLFSFVL